MRERAAGRGHGVHSIERRVLRGDGRRMGFRRRADDDRGRCHGQEKQQEEPDGSADDTPGAFRLRSAARAHARTCANSLRLWPPRHSVVLPLGSRATCTPIRQIGNPIRGVKVVEICGLAMKCVDIGLLFDQTPVASRCVAGSRGRRPSSNGFSRRSNQVSVRGPLHVTRRRRFGEGTGRMIEHRAPYIPSGSTPSQPRAAVRVEV